MAHWTSGYVEDLPYMSGFYRHLTPTMLGFSALVHRRRYEAEAPHLTYCELGCGQGFTANLLAAANPRMDFHAMDFNPGHIANARRLAAGTGLGNVHFYERAFADFAAEPGVPQDFDIIALHGVFSWISPENRAHIVDFIARRLKPGGLVCLSYNAMPGWAVTLPLRRLLVDRAATSNGPIEPRIEDALAFAKTLAEAEAGFFKMNRAADARLQSLSPLSRTYLAHEYFNRDWTPLYFEDVANELAEAKLGYVGSMNLIDAMDDLSLTPAQRDVLEREADPIRREAVRDFLVNQMFRSDLFGKGTPAHSERSAAGIWLQTRFVLSMAHAHIPASAKSRLGEIDLQADPFRALLSAFSAGPRSVRDLLTANAAPDLNWGQVLHGLTVLVGAGHLQPCLGAAAEADGIETCKAFNRAVCAHAEESEDHQFLASPVTGGGVAVSRAERLFLLARSEGQTDAAAWADFAWQVLAPQGQRVLKDGQMLETEAGNRAELLEQAAHFERVRLPTFDTLKVTF